MRVCSPQQRPLASNLQMSAMIDVVFLLLVFFVMTFRITAIEGDVMLQPPVETSESESLAPADRLPLQVRLFADDRGELARLQLNDRELADVAELHQFIQEVCRDNNRAADDWDVVLVCDSHLRYQHLVAASDAVAGFRNAAGEITPLMRRVRFAAPASHARG